MRWSLKDYYFKKSFYNKLMCIGINSIVNILTADSMENSPSSVIVLNVLTTKNK